MRAQCAVLLQCAWHMLVLLVVALLSACASAESVAPRHGVLEADTTFVIEDVEFPYTTCKTTFDGEHGQAVFSSIVNETHLDSAKALCVVRAPFQDDDYVSIGAQLEVSQARGPRSKPEKTSSVSVSLYQSPVVASGAVQYGVGQRFGSVLVQITHIEGFLKGGEALRELLQLSVDLSVLQRSVLRLSLDSFKDADEVAYLIFVLPEFLPSGQYPCVLTINGNPLPLAAPKAPSAASTRTAEQFNASDTAQAAPLLQPAREHTFLVNVDLPVVKMLPQTVELQKLRCGLGDYDAEDETEPVSDDCPLSAVDADDTSLTVELDGPVYYEAAALLVMFPVDMAHHDVMYAVQQHEADSDSEWEDADSTRLTELQIPTAEEPVTIQWVRWDAQVMQQRVIKFKLNDEGDSSSTQFVVRVVDTVGAVASPEHRSAFVFATGSSIEATPAPEFSVIGQQVLHRDGDLEFQLMRSGEVSPLPSVVQWRIVYLDPPIATIMQDEPLLPGTVPPELDTLTYKHPRSNISAVLNSTGTASWAAHSTDTAKMVSVPINWGAVPYVARWMLAVQLSILFNGKLDNDVFTVLTVPRPITDSNQTTLEDQLAVLSPAVAGVTTSLASSTNAILYGVEADTCPPGTGRTVGNAKGVPMPEVLQSHGIHSMALGLPADAPDSSDEADAMLWVPSTPLFNSSANSYDLTIPFGYNNASFVIATSAVGHYVLDGCGNSNLEPQTAPVSRVSSASPIEVDEKGPTGGKLRQLFWPVTQPENSRCTAQLHVCSSETGSTDCADNTARSTYEATITWLQDPTLAVIDAVNVTVGDAPAVRVCASDEEHALAEQECPEDALVRPGANSTHETCSVAECVPHSLVSAGLTYSRGEQIQIAVEPMFVDSVRAVSIGQRVFRAQPGEELGDVAVGFTLFDSSDRLSPFVPFFIQWRSKDRTVLDVPITLTLTDGRTTAPLNLLLDIDVLQPPPAPESASFDANSTTTPESGGVGDLSDDLLSPSAAPVEVITEGTSVSIIDSSPAAQLAEDAGGLVVPAEDIADTGAVFRKLHDVSSSAPHDQQWLNDPLNNAQCSVCAEGLFSDSIDSVCRQCQPGTCAPKQGMTQCAVCPPGTYAAVYGASSCSPCVHGSYAQRPNSRACRLCPFGYTTTADGASICNEALEQTVAIGKQYALAVSLAMRLSGAGLEDVAQRTGVLGPSEDILSFLVALDSADAFNVSTRDVEVVSIEQLQPQELRVLLTTNIGIQVPPNANKQQVNHAIDVAQLSKDSGIGNLTWTHTSEALGAKAVTEDYVTTEVREPDPSEGVSWQAITFPIVAGLVIIGSALMLKIRRSRDNGPIEAVAQTPHLILSRVLVAFRTPVSVIARDRSHMSDVSSEIGVECDEFEVDLRPTRTVGKRGSQQLTEMSVWTSEETRKRNEFCRDVDL